MKLVFAFLLFFFSEIVLAQTRSYLIAMPKDYDTQKSYRMVIGFHGAKLSGNQMRSFMTKLEELSNQDSFFVYPESMDGFWTEKDLKFFDQIVTDMKKDYSINENKIIAIGYSNGGFFANLLARVRPGVVRGVVIVAGGNSGSVLTPAMIIHGNADRWVNYASGYYSAYNWSNINGCTEKPVWIPKNYCYYLAGCKAQTAFCSWQADHDWPRFENADQQIMDFLNSIGA